MLLVFLDTKLASSSSKYRLYMADNTLGLYTPRLSDTFDQFARRKSPYRLDFSYIQQGEKS